MTPDDIAKLRALCEQATQPGPWTVNVNDIGKDGDGHCVVLDAHTAGAAADIRSGAWRASKEQP